MLCERADGQPARAHLARFLLAPAGAAGALVQGDFRARDFGGVFVLPLWRACVDSRRAVRAWLHEHESDGMRVTACGSVAVRPSVRAHASRRCVCAGVPRVSAR